MPEPIPFPTRPAPGLPPDDAERRRALDPTRSFLVQAPAGSGKTHLLTQRFLRLLARAERADEIVAITFTNTAAAEMRNRILEALEAAETESTEASSEAPPEDPLGIPALARAALARSRQRNWQLLEQPAQLRILTIDAFCRYLAMQAPLNWGLLSGLASLETTDQADQLHRRAARRLLERVIDSPSPARDAVESILLWRDNNWRDVENQIVEMLAQRNRWYQDFVFASDIDFTLLRQRLEAPMRRAAHQALHEVSEALHSFPEAAQTLLSIARIACGNCANPLIAALAERPELPRIRQQTILEDLDLEDAVSAYNDLSTFLLTKGEKSWRKQFDITVGFPSGEAGKPLKASIQSLLDDFSQHPSLESALAIFLGSIPLAYTEDEWSIIRSCFVVLSQAYAELQLVFAETGQVDFTEIAQMALRVLTPDADPDSTSSFDHALRIADQIRHLLVDEFQDTSRSQHQLLSSLIAAWPDFAGRTCFCVGDPMQSIYGFRDAEVELFDRLKTHGLDLPNDLSSTTDEPFRFESVTLQANFRTTPTLVDDLNTHFANILPNEAAKAGPDDVSFTPAIPARAQNSTAHTELHLDFTLAPGRDAANFPNAASETTRQSQLDRIVALVRDHVKAATQARASTPPSKYRIAILGRTRGALVRIAEALRNAQIPYRAVKIVSLRERPEILDALALVRASLNPADRRAWLGVLRAPWCGLSLAELHALTSDDDSRLLDAPIPALLDSRLTTLVESGKVSPPSAAAVARLLRCLAEAHAHRAEAASFTLGTSLEALWSALGGTATVNAEAYANLRLLWTTLDSLPSAEAGLLSTELDNALDRLYALPDPEASSDFGVQLMTIHQSKGLEFEIVLLPELESRTRSTTPTMISWLERGLPADDPFAPGELTEFLIAPIASKGSKAGDARLWVDRMKNTREQREQRRLLYVAATRAREQLHLFARPIFYPGNAGPPTLRKPAGLLATAWPAFSTRIEDNFRSWIAVNSSPSTPASHPAPLALAASQANLFPAPVPTRLYRLPAAFAPEAAFFSAISNASELAAEGDQAAYERTPGSLYSRLQGTVIHASLEEAARLRQSAGPDAVATGLEAALSRLIALVRSRGVAPADAAALAREAIKLAREILSDPIGAWILHPHPHSAVESRWTGLVQSSGGPADATLRHLRPDRVFHAAPQTPAAPASWWIIDYKTAQLSASDLRNEAARRRFLENHRAQHAAQLHAYAQLLRGMDFIAPGAEIRLGLFYPRLLLFDSWPAPNA